MNIDHLLRLCDEATPGPWDNNHGEIVADTREQVCCGKGYDSCCGCPDVIGGVVKVADAGECDSAYIAALDPATVKELCRGYRERDRLKAVIDWLLEYGDLSDAARHNLNATLDSSPEKSND